MEISNLVATASKTLATNKSEMKALLSQWKADAKESKMSPGYQRGLDQALEVLNRSASLPELVAKLRRLEQESVANNSSTAM